MSYQGIMTDLEEGCVYSGQFFTSVRGIEEVLALSVFHTSICSWLGLQLELLEAKPLSMSGQLAVC